MRKVSVDDKLRIQTLREQGLGYSRDHGEIHRKELEVCMKAGGGHFEQVFK